MILDSNRIIGGGVIFPLTVVDGGVRIDSGIPLIESSLKNIFSYQNNQRFFLGEFSTRLHELIERPLDSLTLSLINDFVIETVETWEKRITLKSIEKYIENEVVYVNLNYVVNNTQVEGNFIFPFYSTLIY
jgi:phage baseplate assembly protein W